MAFLMSGEPKICGGRCAGRGGRRVLQPCIEAGCLAATQQRTLAKHVDRRSKTGSGHGRRCPHHPSAGARPAPGARCGQRCAPWRLAGPQTP
jgi:hypothetical protein